jgi:hypothetical protein
MKQKKREKMEVISDLQRIKGCRDSEGYKLFAGITREEIARLMLQLLSGEIKTNEIIDLVFQARAHYKLLMMVPGEEYSLLNELERIERFETDAVDQFKSSLRQVNGGSIG